MKRLRASYSLPQLLARHRADKNCASCHQRFDSIGLVFEGFGPIGERRDRDLGDRPVETKATFPDGSEGEGVGGLRRYIAERREDDFVENLCRELLVYALGRGLILSDEPTIKAMRDRLSAEGHRFDSLIETIVTSPQFLKKRGRDDRRETQGVTQSPMSYVPRRGIIQRVQVARNRSSATSIRELSDDSRTLQNQSANRAPRRGRHDGPSLAGIDSGLGRTRPHAMVLSQPFPSDSPRSSWATASIPSTGRPRVPARTWS